MVKNGVRTSRNVASAASKALRKQVSRNVKRLAASALRNRHK